MAYQVISFVPKLEKDLRSIPLGTAIMGDFIRRIFWFSIHFKFSVTRFILVPSSSWHDELYREASMRLPLEWTR